MRTIQSISAGISAAVRPDEGAQSAARAAGSAAGASGAGAAPVGLLDGATSGPEGPVPVTLGDLARLLGLPDDREWRAVLASLVRDALPLTRELAERAMALWRRSGLPEPEAAALLWLDRRGLAPLPERVALLRAFRRAHPDPAGPPDEALMVAAHIARGSAPLRLSIWPTGLADEPARATAPGVRESVPEADSASDDARRAAPARPRRSTVVLLTVETAHLGEIEALIELADDRVAVTCFSECTDAAAALAAGLDRLREALAAVGLMPTALAARSAEPGRDEAQRVRRIDVKL